jgi:hypothetical protein
MIDPPTFLIGPAVALARWARKRHQRRRRVRLTVHTAYLIDGAGNPIGPDHYYVNVTNASPERDITVTHVWFDTAPQAHIVDPALPRRLQYAQPWETAIPVAQVLTAPDKALWLARCRLSPDGKVVKSRPAENVPPIGTVPR